MCSAFSSWTSKVLGRRGAATMHSNINDLATKLARVYRRTVLHDASQSPSSPGATTSSL